VTLTSGFRQKKRMVINGLNYSLLCLSLSSPSTVFRFSMVLSVSQLLMRMAAAGAMMGPPSRERLDFRFAMDEIDASDIAALVNDACLVEQDGGVLSFRRPGPTLAAADVEHDLLSNGAARWVVLDTPPPEELVVAAARFVLDAERRVGVVDVLCATAADRRATDPGADVSALERARLTLLVRKLESVVWSHAYTALVVEVARCAYVLAVRRILGGRAARRQV